MKFLPRRELISSFGDGGFRFGGMSHQGGLLILPSGMRAWNPSQTLVVADFDHVLPEREAIDVLLIGTGTAVTRVSPEVAAQLSAHAINFDCMTTSAAIHTYNVMLAEDRRIAAVLVPVP